MSTPSSDGDQTFPRKRGRSVPAVYGIVSLVLVVGAVTFALSTPPPSTPPLAAVAPAPQEQLEVERVEQSSQFGEGAGGAGDCVPGDPACAGVGEEPPSVEEHDVPGEAPAGQDEQDVVETRAPADLRRCVHGPGGPRQTDDPQSPPCMQEIFSGDNGGATSTGVTRDTIRVAVPEFSGCWGLGANGQGVDCDRDFEVLEAFAAHVNTHYELYGRRVELVQVADADSDDPAGQRAYASEIAALDPFAVLGWGAGELPFHRALAERGVVSFADGVLSAGRVYDPLHPYVWGVYPSAEASAGATAELVCSSLVGRLAQHGGAAVAEQTRRFGIIQQVSDGEPMHVATLVSRLEACGAPHTVRSFDRDSDDRDLVLAGFVDDGVTTVVCVCTSPLRSWTNDAEARGYEPEWLLAGLSSTATSEALGDHKEQKGRVFGLTPRLQEPVDTAPGPSRSLQFEQQFWFHVLKEERPDWNARRSDHPLAFQQYGFYAQLVMLASGVQWAGPELTPQSFGDALTGLAYPNPGVGQDPWFQPAVGFDPGDHTFNSDFALAWFDAPTEEEEQARVTLGQFCYLGDGARFTSDTIPADADAKFFDAEAGCR